LRILNAGAQAASNARQSASIVVFDPAQPHLPAYRGKFVGVE